MSCRNRDRAWRGWSLAGCDTSRDSMPPFDLLLSVTPLGRALGKLGWIPLGSVPVTLCVPAWESRGTGAASPAGTPRFSATAPWTGLGLAVISQGSRTRPWSCLIPSELDMDRGRGDEGEPSSEPASATAGQGWAQRPVGQPGLPGPAPLCAAGSAACSPPPRPHTAWASYFLILLLLRAGRAGCWQLSGIRGPLGTPGQRGQDRQLCSR